MSHDSPGHGAHGDQAGHDTPGHGDHTGHDHEHAAHDHADHVGAHDGHDHGDHEHGALAGDALVAADASVRAARTNDVPALGIVQAAVWTEAYAGRVPDEVFSAFRPEAFAAGWRTALESPPEGVHRLLVACAGAQVVGLAAIGPSQDPDTGQQTGEVTVLGVHPQGRRQGHGSRLLNACVDLLREAGAEAVIAWVAARDDGTRSFLQASGMAPDGAYRDRIVGPDDETLREVRLVARLTEDAEPAVDAESSPAAVTMTEHPTSEAGAQQDSPIETTNNSGAPNAAAAERDTDDRHGEPGDAQAPAGSA